MTVKVEEPVKVKTTFWKRITAWHERLGTTIHKITVGEYETKAMEFVFKGHPTLEVWSRACGQSLGVSYV